MRAVAMHINLATQVERWKIGAQANKFTQCSYLFNEIHMHYIAFLEDCQSGNTLCMFIITMVYMSGYFV